ncbi:MAG TPA: hypothetical protein VN031_03320 [Candidatus Microsaccharimonas sp.]|nr:hypothetical protein [Candidatus Microsaccharimonas sp.]
MKKQTIAVDIDDVLAAETEFIIEFSNKHFGHNLTREEYTEHWGDLWAVDLEEVERRAELIHEPGNVSSYPLIEGGRDVLEHLKKHYRLVILTSRRDRLRQETLTWLDQHFPGVFDEVRFTGFFDTLHEDRHLLTKADLLVEMGAEYLIDDQLKHCIGSAEAGLNVILFGDRATHRDSKLPSNVTRCSNWSQVQEYFDGIRS